MALKRKNTDVKKKQMDSLIHYTCPPLNKNKTKTNCLIDQAIEHSLTVYLEALTFYVL